MTSVGIQAYLHCIPSVSMWPAKVNWHIFPPLIGSDMLLGLQYSFGAGEGTYAIQTPKLLCNLWLSGPEEGVIMKGVFSLERSLQSPKCLDSWESLEKGRILLCFPQSGGSLESLDSLEILEHGLF